MHTDSVVYDGQPGQPSLVHTDSVVYDGQPGQPSLVHTDRAVYDGQLGQLSEGKNCERTAHLPILYTISFSSTFILQANSS